MSRADGRELHEMRAVKIQRNHTMHAEGSVLISFGNTKVLCNAPSPPEFQGSKRTLARLGNGGVCDAAKSHEHQI